MEISIYNAVDTNKLLAYGSIVESYIYSEGSRIVALSSVTAL